MGKFSSTTRLHLWPLSRVLKKRRHYNVTTILTRNKERRTGTLCYSCSQHRHPRAMRKHTFKCCNWNMVHSVLEQRIPRRKSSQSLLWPGSATDIPGIQPRYRRMAFRANLAPQNSSGVEQNAKGKTGTFFPVQEGFIVMYAGGSFQY